MDSRDQAAQEQAAKDPMFKSRIIEAIHREVAAGAGEEGAAHMRGIKKTGRPLRMILLAYHAFANVLLFYRRLKKAGADEGYCSLNEEQLIGELTQLEQPLRATSALTPIGHALWRPISEKLRCEH